VTPCGCPKNWRFRGTRLLRHQGGVSNLGVMLALTSNRSTLTSSNVLINRLPIEENYEKIWGFHSGDYEECHLVECDALSLFLYSIPQLLVTHNVHSSLILSTLMVEAIRFSETSVLTSHVASHARKWHSS
jgi:hypothetical protein